jgi:ATP-dependent Clp protease protease subunit
MSSGQMLLISGTKGKRFILPHSRVLIHGLSSGTWGTLPEMLNEVEESKRMQKMLDGLILKYTKIKKAELAELISKDSYITAEDAVRMGIVDFIVNSPSQLYKKISL